jgi:ATP-binding cassette subfamily B protein
LQTWLAATGRVLGLEVEPVEASYPELDSLLANCGPALVRLEFGHEQRFLAVLRSRRGKLHTLTPDLKIHRMPCAVVRANLCRTVEEPLVPEITTLLDQTGLDAGDRQAALSSILRERLGTVPIQRCWMIRLPPGSAFYEQLNECRLIQRLALFASLQLIESLLVVASWWMIGRVILHGWLDYGWFLAWALLLLTQIPCRLAASWIQGVIVIRGGSILKRRLLAGSLQLQPEEVRSQGVGQLLGRVIESEALESMAMSSGLAGLSAVISALVAMFVLAAGAGSTLLAVLFTLWIVILCVFGRAYLRQRKAWTEKRLEITHALIERMVGHRTRLAQEPRSQWHESEDHALVQYLESCSRMDHRLAAFLAVIPRGWLIVSLAVLLPGFVRGAIDPTTLAVALGGTLLAGSALKTLTDGLTYAIGAFIAWQQVRLLFDAAAREEPEGAPANEVQDRVESGEVLAECRDVVYQHEGRAAKILDGCSLRIFHKDRILLQGPSGCGKSTLAAVLTGLRQPQSGLLLLNGLDRSTIGARAWRHTMAATPQFHENHVLTSTLAFNLLMGRGWPPTPEDLDDAEMICRELGLGPLLDRMPSGLTQTVGETGWQLSHGEKSRVFLARALLQKADCVVLDESLAALDPENVKQAMRCVRDHAETLVVIAHP